MPGPIVTLESGRLVWTYTPGNVPADSFTVKTGTTSGVYTRLTSVPASTREVLIRNVVPGAGAYFAVVQAVNRFGGGATSNEVPFECGSAPDGSLSLEVVA